METIKERFEQFYNEILYSYSGTPKVEEIKSYIRKFKETASRIGLEPADPRYYIEETAVVANYVGSDLEKDRVERDNLTIGLLTTLGYEDSEIKSINNRINKDRYKREILAIRRKELEIKRIRKKIEESKPVHKESKLVQMVNRFLNK